MWALGVLSQWLAFNNIPPPHTVTTDRELALTNALATWFPGSAKLLCRWHVNKNVIRYCKPLYPKDPENPKEPGPEFRAFYTAYTEVIESPSQAEYLERLSRFRAFHTAETVGYVENTWLTPYKEQLVKYYVDQ